MFGKDQENVSNRAIASKQCLDGVMSSNKLVSFCVKCYNQELYIREALEGAFSQTYRPIEFVVSNDASTDDSDRIIRAVVAEHGFARVGKICDANRVVENFQNSDCVLTLITNKKNCGNCGNWQVICDNANGELIVKADGDDISLPNRTVRIVEEWLKAGCGCGIVYHNAFKIDCVGREIGDATREVFDKKLSLGAVMACSRECIDKFGGCAVQNAYDDIVYHRRAQMLGLQVIRFDEKLVKYRIGSGSSTRGHSYSKTMGRNIRIISMSLECSIADLEMLKGCMPEDSWYNLHTRYVGELKNITNELCLWDSSSFIIRFRSFRMVHPKVVCSRQYVIHLFLLLPFNLGKYFLDLLYRLDGLLK